MEKKAYAKKNPHEHAFKDAGPGNKGPFFNNIQTYKVDITKYPVSEV